MIEAHTLKLPAEPFLLVLLKRVLCSRCGLVEASVKNNVACIHMFNISGGTQSASVWRSKGLLSNDRIHYKIAGYEMQAEFIYNTLLKSYLKYVNN